MRRSRSWYVVRLVLLFGLGLAACARSNSRTEIVVVVTSDLEAELGYVRAVASAAEGDDEHLFSIASDPSKVAKTVTPPFSFTVLPPDGDAAQPVELAVEGLGRDKVLLVRRRARLSFVPGQTRTLQVSLSRDCGPLYQACEAQGHTCEANHCVYVDVDIDVRVVAESVDDEEGERTGCDASLCEAAEASTGVAQDVASAARDATLPVLPDASPSLDAGVDGAAGDAGASAEDASGAAFAEAGAMADSGAVNCGVYAGFFANSDRFLQRTQQRRLCPLVAQHVHEELGALTQTKEALLSLLDRTEQSPADIYELQLGEFMGSAVVLGLNSPRAHMALATLDHVFSHADIARGSQMLELYISESVESHTAFARTVLDLLLQYRATPGVVEPGFVADCKPVYLSAGGQRGIATLDAVRALLASDTRYASLVGRAVFGERITSSTLEGAQADLYRVRESGRQFVEVDLTRSFAVELIAYAQGKGLSVIARNAESGAEAAWLCALADMIGTTHFQASEGDKFAAALSTTQTLLVLDARYPHNDATTVHYQLPPGGVSTRSIGQSGEPVLEPPLLQFDRSPARLVLEDAVTTPRALDFALSLRFSRIDLAEGQRQVVLSKLSADTGYELSLTRSGGVLQLRLSAYLDVAGAPVRLSVALSDPALMPGGSVLVRGAFDGSALRLTLGARSASEPVRTSGGASASGTLRINTKPVTLGADPDAAAAPWSGGLEWFGLGTSG